MVAPSLGSSTSKGANSATVLVPLREQAQPNARFSKFKSNILSLSLSTQALSGLSEVSLANSLRNVRRPGKRSILKASSCNWIDLEKVREEGSGCVDGSKFVLTKDRGVSKISPVKNIITVKGDMWRGSIVVVDIEAKPHTIFFHLSVQIFLKLS